MEMRLSLLAVLEKRAAAPGAPSNTACGAGGVSAGRTWEIPAALQAGGAFGYSFQSRAGPSFICVSRSGAAMKIRMDKAADSAAYFCVRA